MAVVTSRTTSDLAGLAVVEIVLLGALDGLRHGVRGAWVPRSVGIKWGEMVCDIISLGRIDSDRLINCERKRHCSGACACNMLSTTSLMHTSI